MKNKKYGLALWWGGARWLAHAWVLKVLKEKWVEINEVAWTSSGAILWALIALGLTPEEIEKKAEWHSMKKFFSFWKHKGFIWTKKIKEKMIELFWEAEFKDCKIPLTIIAISLTTWKIHEFKSWKIYDAVMASISIPILLEPYKIWNELYIDWCILNNLPIDSIKNNDVIAVSVTIDNYDNHQKKQQNKLFPIVWYWFLSQIIPIIANEENTLKYTKKNVVFLRPDVKNLWTFDFKKAKEFIKKGEEEANKTLWKLDL